MIDAYSPCYKPAPLVSVILPVYNSALYIREAIESILYQTYEELELLVYDDCSTDDSVQIIEEYRDPRIKLFRKERNTGYTESLKMGVAASCGKYIVRMDSDDISDRRRIEKQVAFLEGNPAYGIVGSWVRTMEENGQSRVWEYPLDDEDIKLYLLVNSPFAHPSVAIRKQVLTDNNINYSCEYEPCEDYKLWTDILRVSRGANLGEVLLYYRLHSSQTISRRRERLIERSNQVRKEVIRTSFGKSLADADVRVHYFYFNEIASRNAPSIEDLARCRKRLAGWFNAGGGDKKGIALIDRYWVMHLRCLSAYKPRYLKFLADGAVVSGLTWKEIIKFAGKCLIRYRIR